MLRSVLYKERVTIIKLQKLYIYTQVVIVSICIAIIVVVNTQSNYPYFTMNTLAIMGVIVALFQAYIQRKMKKGDN